MDREEAPVLVNQIEGDWRTYTDSELLGRLLRRGIEPVYAKGLIRDRALDEQADEIDTILNTPVVGPDKKEVRVELPLDRRARR